MQFLDLTGLKALWNQITTRIENSKPVVGGMSQPQDANAAWVEVTDSDVISVNGNHKVYTVTLHNAASNASVTNAVEAAKDALYGADHSEAVSPVTMTSLKDQLDEIEASVGAIGYTSDGSIAITDGEEEGTKDFSVNVDGLTVVKDATSKALKSGLKLVEAEGTGTVAKTYTLTDAEGTAISGSAVININKDQSFKGGRIVDAGQKIHETDESAVAEDTLVLTYVDATGADQDVAIPVGSFLRESEFGDGLQVNGGEVSVKRANGSESFLTVDENGVKISGVQNAIDSAVAAEAATARAAEEANADAIDAINDKIGGNFDSTNTVAKAIEDAKNAAMAAGTKVNEKSTGHVTVTVDNSTGHDVVTIAENNIASADALDDLTTRVGTAEGGIDALKALVGETSVASQINTKVADLDSNILASGVATANQDSEASETETGKWVLSGLQIEDGLIINSGNTKAVKIEGIPVASITGLLNA